MTAKQQSGFAAIPIILAIAAVVAIGLIGYSVYQTQSKTTSSNNSTANTHMTTMSSQPSNTQTNAVPAQADTYLDIKELGIKIKLSDGVKDAVYYYSPADNAQYPQYKGGATLSTQSLVSKDASCKPSGSVAPLGSITKITGDVDGKGVKLVANGNTIFKVGDSFYILQGPQSPCATTSDAQSLNTSQTAAFAEAFKTLQLDK